jgi:hypothetical protein
LNSIRKTLAFFDSADAQTGHNENLRVQNGIKEFDPLLLNIGQAMEYIRKAETVALGQRVCRALHPGSAYTESVFLDDLAIVMIRSGQARKACAEDAQKSLEKSPGHPFIISRVSGKHQEICASIPSECVYWKAEKKGLRCLKPLISH